jgi:hypothetical protein
MTRKIDHVHCMYGNAITLAVIDVEILRAVPSLLRAMMKAGPHCREMEAPTSSSSLRPRASSSYVPSHLLPTMSSE